MNNHKLLFILVLAVLLLVGVIYYSGNKRSGVDYQTKPQSMNPTPKLADDNTAAISSDIESVDLGDIDQEFAEIDRDLNSL